MVFADRSANGGLDVEQPEDLGRRDQPGLLQPRREVVALEPFVDPGREKRSAETIPSGFRHDRHLRPAGLRFPEVARDAERDFLRVLHVGHVP